MIRLILAVILLVQLPLILTAQPAVDFFRLYDNGREEMFYDVFKVNGDGYILCGETGDEFIWQQVWRRWILRGDVRIWLVRIDSEGEIIWSRTYPGLDQMAGAMSIIETDEGNFITVGKTNLNNVDLPYALLVDADGNEIWSNTYGDADGDFRSVIELKDGGFVIAGSRQGNGLAVLINGEGRLLWETVLDPGHDNDKFSAMRETAGGVVLAGYGANGGLWTVKLNFDGDVIWNHIHRPQRTTYTYTYDIVSTRDNGFVISGGVSLEREPHHSVALFKINNEGELMWSEYFLLPGEGFRSASSNGFGMAKLDHDDFVVVGARCLHLPGAVCTDQNGDLRWSETYDFDLNLNLFADDDWSYFQKAIRGPNNEIVSVGTIEWTFGEDNPFTRDAFLTILEPQFLEPQIIEYIPQDTVFTVLVGDTIDFTVRARDAQNDELSYLWVFNQDTLGADTTVTIIFEERGEHLVQCFVTDDEFVVSIRWHVNAVEWYIDMFQPDSSEITIRRGSSIDFTHYVRSIDEREFQYRWEHFGRGGDFEFEGEDSVRFTFDLTGEHLIRAGVLYENELKTVEWDVNVHSIIWWWWPHEFELSVPQDTTMVFEVFPFNEESDSLEYSWFLNDEELDSNNSSIEIPFTEIDEYQITAYANEGIEADTIHWTVDVLERSFTADDVDLANLPTSPVLYPPIPNPFNSSVKISYYLPERTMHSLIVYDLKGRTLNNLVNDKLNPGAYSLIWKAEYLPTGMYFLKMETPDQTEIKKLILVR